MNNTSPPQVRADRQLKGKGPEALLIIASNSNSGHKSQHCPVYAGGQGQGDQHWATAGRLSGSLIGHELLQRHATRPDLTLTTMAGPDGDLLLQS